MSGAVAEKGCYCFPGLRNTQRHFSWPPGCSALVRVNIICWAAARNSRGCLLRLLRRCAAAELASITCAGCA
jgi:hypothetical protein